MSSQKIVFTTYRDPNTNTPRSGSTAHVESMVDFEQYDRPLEKIHGSGLHGWGIGSGMALAASIGAASVKVMAGIGLDVDGRQISMAVAGKAEIGPGADQPGAVPNLVDVFADPNGATLPTPAAAAGNYYVTVRFWETFDWDAYNTSYQQVFQVLHTPWLRLVPTAGFVDDGHVLVLAQVTLDAAGNVTAVSEGLRRGTAIPVEAVKLKHALRSGVAPALTVDNAPSGEIRARTGGGIQVNVPNAADEVHIERPGGSFARLDVAAEHLGVHRNDGKETVAINAAVGNIDVGTLGVEGDVLVKDASNRLVITLDGGNAAVIVGANGNDGDVSVRDGTGQNTVRLIGASGTAQLRKLQRTNDQIEVDARFFRIHGWDLCLDGRSGGNKRALVDANNQLVVNWANDYANGVTINGLHASDHVKMGYWERNNEWNPGNNAWHTLVELPTGLPAAQWTVRSITEIGMFDWGTVDNFWWQTRNVSYTDNAGNRVVKWQVMYNDTGTDFMPWNRIVLWIAVRL